MASGLLGKATLVANTDTVLYTGAVNEVTTASVTFCNTGASSATVRLALGAGPSANKGDYIVYELTIPVGGFFERSGIVFGAGENLIVRANSGSVDVRAHGFGGSM